MPRISTAIAVVGIDIGKNSFHIVGIDPQSLRSSHRPRRVPLSLRLHAVMCSQLACCT